MISSFSVTLMAAYLLCMTSASAQQTDTTHVHDHNHGHTHQHSTSGAPPHSHGAAPRTTAHPHEHQHVHGHTHEHQHVHDHGVAHSHDEFTVAFIGNLATHNASFNSLPPIENCCTGFSDSKGLGFGFEFGYTTPLTSDGLTITPHIGYVNMPVSFDSYSTEKAFTGGVVSGDALFRHTLDVTWTTVTFGARIEYPVLGGFYLGFGLDGYFFATGSFHQTETLEEPSNLVFETGTRVRLDKNGYVRGHNDVVFSATGSARIRLIEKQHGSVGVDIFGRYSLPLQPLFMAQTWKGMYGNPPATFYIDSYTISMLTFGLGLVF